MVKRKLKKGIFVILVISMVVSLFTSCTKGGSSDPQTSTQSQATSSSPADTSTQKSTVPLYTERKDTKGMSMDEIMKGDIIYAVPNIKFPISDTPITLHFMVPQIPGDIEYTKMTMLQDYEKKTNIHIEWNQPPYDSYGDKFNLAMASGQYPDAIFFPSDSSIEKYGQQGVFIPFNEYLENDMPNLKATLEKYPEVKKVITTDDKKVYCIPLINEYVTGNNIMMIRQEWLDKLGLKVPETTDEWYNTLKAFKAMDPANIWPISDYNSSNTNAGMTDLSTAGFEIRCNISAWGVYPDGFYAANSPMQPNDGKMHFGQIEPRYKEGLEWLHKLYAEKLIDPEFITNDRKSMHAKILNGQVGAIRGWASGDLKTLNDTAKSNGKTDFHMVECPVMKGPEGDQVLMWKDTRAYRNAFVMTSANKYPRETAIWCDYWYSDWGRTYCYGIENVTWVTGSDGQPQWTDYVTKNPDGKTADEIRGSICFGRDMWPMLFQPENLTTSMDDPVINASRLKYRLDNLMVMPVPEGLSFAKEENDLIAQKMNDISTYVNEMFIKFVIGKEPLSKWDAYVKKVNDMGMTQILEIYNKSYERWKAR